MSIDAISQAIQAHGYLIIAVFLFFGIVGIPAPEESLLFLVGLLIAHHQLSFGAAVVSSILGAFVGMLTAYGFGKFVGFPFIIKFGKYVGITVERWEKAKNKYSKNVHKTILFGFYMPGIRQISPYFAGISKHPFNKFVAFSLLGTILWVGPYIVAGYYAGNVFRINPEYVPYAGLLLFVIFLAYVFIKSKIIKPKVKGIEFKTTSDDPS
ncbi:DedA family protein [Schinkia sp. CFF1]